MTNPDEPLKTKIIDFEIIGKGLYRRKVPILKIDEPRIVQKSDRHD